MFGFLVRWPSDPEHEKLLAFRLVSSETTAADLTDQLCKQLASLNYVTDHVRTALYLGRHPLCDVCVCVCVYYMYMCVCMCVYYMYVCVCVYYMYVCVCDVCVCVCACTTCTCVCMCAYYMYVCVCVCVCCEML